LTEHISAKGHDINNLKETCQSTDTPPYAPQIWLKFGSETTENGWRVFAHPSKFSHWDTALQSRTTECLAGSTGLCHASSIKSNTSLTFTSLSVQFTSVARKQPNRQSNDVTVVQTKK